MDEKLEKIQFRLTSPGDSHELDRKRVQSYGRWESWRRIEKNQLVLWFEHAATYATQEFESSQRNASKSKQQKARDLGRTIGALLTIGLLFRAVSETKTECRPPFNAEYLLHFFLRREERDEVIGDLIESYAHILRRFSKRRADIWFYKQVAASLWPLFRRAVMKLVGLVWLGRFLRRLIS
jgi:hypothetical protein